MRGTRAFSGRSDFRRISLGAALLVGIGAAAARGAFANAEGNKPGQPGVLQPRDRIEVQVHREPQLSGLFTVSPSGSVHLPLIGEVPIAGRTPREAASEIEGRLSTYLRRPKVEVNRAPGEAPVPVRSEPPTAAGGHTLYISGAVREPGAYFVSEPITALQLLIRAGGVEGLTAGASEEEASSAREPRIFPDLKRVSIVGAGGEVQVVDLSGMGRRNLELEVLKPGDTVIVPGHTGGTFAIYGWVGRPGVYTMNQPILLTEALAQGVPDERFADLTQVKIIRGDPENPEAFTVNLDRLHSKKSVDLLPVVKPGDTVYVPRNWFSRVPFAQWIAARTRGR